MQGDTMQGSNTWIGTLVPVIHRAALAGAGEVRLDVGEPEAVGPAVSVVLGVMAVAVITAIR
jgi:hypothetical protein